MRELTHVVLGALLAFGAGACGGPTAEASAPAKPAPSDDVGNCTPTSKPTDETLGHCDFAMGTAGDVCSQATGATGKDVALMRQRCTAVSGTFSPGPCKPSPQGSCLQRCGTANESIDTIYFATPAEHKTACEARKATFIAP